MAQLLAKLGPLPIISSPLARALETSQALAALWDCEPKIEERVAEIPSFFDNDTDRKKWLSQIMQDRWSNLSRELQNWRQGVIDTLCLLKSDTMIFTHFIGINAAFGEATGDDRVVVFHPDNCSVTILENSNFQLSLVEKGTEAETIVR